MELKEAAPIRSPLGGGTSTNIQFLSLYLLVLAFFILLVTISTFEDIKSNAVMDSLTSTFATVLPPTTSLTTYTSKSGDVLAGQEFQEDVMALFATALGVTKVDVIQPGRVMRVQFSAEEMFIAGGTGVREAWYSFLDRLARTLGARPPGLVHELEFLIGSDTPDGNLLPVTQTLELARAGEFARQMRARGAPPDSISIGLRKGDPKQVTTWFYVRSDQEFRQLIDIISPPPEAQ